VQDTVGTQRVETRTETKPDTKTRVFISYSRKDMEFADRLEAALKARGFQVLIDRAEIYAFEDWWKRIQALIGGADTVVFVVSPDSVKSEVALKEVSFAASLNKRFAPIVCRQVEDGAVPEALRRLNFIFFDDAARFDESADKLGEALQTHIEWIRDHTKFGEAARVWIAAGRPNGLLLRTPALEMAEYWIASCPRGAPEPTEDIRKFVAASRQSSRSGQRLRRIAFGSILMLMLAVIFGFVGWINQDYLKTESRWWSVTWPYERADVRPYVLSAARELELKPGQTFRECSGKQSVDYCPDMVVVPAGSFIMGAPRTETDSTIDERPQHSVTFAKQFAVSKYETTFDEWDTCVAYGDCRPAVDPNGRGQQPVIRINWDDAQQYVAWLAKVTGKTYRLLSEAEYEYATRAGTTTAYPWGDVIDVNGQAMANCAGCGGQYNAKTVPVGSFAPNGFGLYDMVGNVYEWVEDCFHDNYNGAPKDGSAWTKGWLPPGSTTGAVCFRVARGAYFNSVPDDLRSAHRSAPGDSSYRDIRMGFRVARTLLAP
jgi:formylglycine-generating enzyme required for sulfatase activity